LNPCDRSTNLYEKISKALEPIFLTQDEYDFLEMAINDWQDKEELINPSIDYDVDPSELLDRLEDIVLTEEEELS
jgi:hypothetical protein